MNKYTWKLNVDKWSEWFAKHHDTVPTLISTDIEISIMSENKNDATKSLETIIDKSFLDFQEDK